MRIPVQINWGLGEISYLKITEREEKVAADEYSKILLESDVRLRVLEKTDTSYTLEWTYTKVEATVEEFQLRGAILRMGQEEEIRTLINKLLESSEESTIGMRVVYTTDNYGSFKEVVNREELRDQYKKAFLGMISTMTAELPTEKRDSLTSFFAFMSEAMVSDPEFGITFEDIQLMHQAYGYEYEVGQTLKAEGTWPSPFTDDDYPVDVELKLDNYDSSLKKATLKGTNTIGDEAMQLFLEDLKVMLATYGISPDEADISYEIKSDFNLNIDLSYGWIYDAHMVTRTKENHDITTNTMDIKLRL